MRGFDPDDRGPGCRAAPDGVADEADPVAHHDALAAELAGLHRDDDPADLAPRPSYGGGSPLDQAGVAAAVDGHHETLDRVLVRRADAWYAAGNPARP